VLITAGRGREVFHDSARLMKRLGEAVACDEIRGIQTASHYVEENGIAALQTMLRNVGFGPFRRAAFDAGRLYSRFGTRWNWRFLGEYLGWEWRAF
jgi:hypothetical protein